VRDIIISERNNEKEREIERRTIGKRKREKRGIISHAEIVHSSFLFLLCRQIRRRIRRGEGKRTPENRITRFSKKKEIGDSDFEERKEAALNKTKTC
jgi:hypothetical protein